MGIRNT
nr:unnamed protein product [Callosobruchus analis]